MTPTPLPQTSNYSLAWALGVVQTLQGKYARGTEIVCESLRIDTRKMAKILATRPVAWAIIRASVKNWDRIANLPGKPSTDPKYVVEHMARLLHKGSVYNDESFNDYLTWLLLDIE